jgi:NAD(P)-dependent dehydrogenase (short-subunit alcohol dehydrogenase family)
MSSVHGKVAVVTGAGSGIGRQLAIELARRGARVAVSDVDEQGLAATADRVTALGGEVLAARLDVREHEAVAAHADAVAARFGVVHQVYANAGVAGGGRTVLEMDLADHAAGYERTIGINLFGVIHTVRAFLPHVIASGDGHVVTVSSLNGILAQPTMSDYCASKFAVRGFTETLRSEMLAGGVPVQVTVVHPGGVRTGIARASVAHAEREGLELTPAQRARARTYDEKLLKMPPEQAARIVLDGVEAGRPRVLVGNDAKVVDLLVRLAPRLAPALSARMEKRIFGAG